MSLVLVLVGLIHTIIDHDTTDSSSSSSIRLNGLYHHLLLDLANQTQKQGRDDLNDPNHSNAIEIRENNNVSIQGSKVVIKKKETRHNSKIYEVW